MTRYKNEINEKLREVMGKLDDKFPLTIHQIRWLLYADWCSKTIVGCCVENDILYVFYKKWDEVGIFTQSFPPYVGQHGGSETNIKNTKFKDFFK